MILWYLLVVSKSTSRKPLSFPLKGKNRAIFLMPTKALGIGKFEDLVFSYENVHSSSVFSIPS